MKCTLDLKWKYLRESSKKYFDPKRNTPLETYLSSIFPNDKFEYQSSIKKDELPEGVRPRRYVCDAISKELKLVVEFDGVNHYMDSQIVLNDLERDEWFKDLGYRVVRIPYWIQLSKSTIRDLFGLEVDEKYCELDHNFYNPENEKVNLNILPGSMCELGRVRFVKEFNRFGIDVRCMVFNDLLTCFENVDDDIVETVVPLYILDRLDIHEVIHILDYRRFDQLMNAYRHLTLDKIL